MVDTGLNRVEQLEPGLIAYARGGKDIRFNQPSATGSYGEYTRRDAVANALLHRFSPMVFQLEDAARQYRGMTLLELARESLGNTGVNTRGLSRDEVATRALHSTSDFPEILSAVTNKTLLQAYDAYPRTFALFCRQVLATDFKSMHRVQLGEAPQLLEVGESGQFKRGTLGESKESYKVKTYGRVVAITRQVLINDDLDAFTRIPAMYGNSIAQLESDVVWGIMTANPAMADCKAAVSKVLCATWQRCRVHFQRNALAHAGKSGRRVVSAFIATAFAQDTAEAASAQWRAVANQIRPKVPKLATIMDEAEHDVLAYMSFPKEHRAKLHSTTPVERLNGEIKRRTDVVGIFPNDDAIVRLVGALLLEQNDEWAVQRARYMTLETIGAMRDYLVISLPAAAS